MEKARNPNAPVDVDALARQLSADPMSEARTAMAARNFQRVIDLTTEVLTNDLMNEEARVLNEQAREKLEAAPFVDQFVKKAEQAIASGNVSAAREDLEKIKSLDADDTAIARLESAVKTAKPSAPSSSTLRRRRHNLLANRFRLIPRPPHRLSAADFPSTRLSPRSPSLRPQISISRRLRSRPAQTIRKRFSST